MIIGLPKTLEEYAPLDPQEFTAVKAQLVPAIEQGTPPETPIQVDFGTFCRLASTVSHFAAAIAAARAQMLANAAPAEPSGTIQPPYTIFRPSETVTE